MSLLERFTLLQGFDSDSASRTDIWEVLDRATNQRCICKVFVNYFHITSLRTNKTYRETLSETELYLHEMKTYKALRDSLITNPAVNCRNILCVLGEATFDATELKKFIDASTNLNPAVINCNIYQNTLFMLRLKSVRKRYSITKNSCKPLKLKERDLRPLYSSSVEARLDLPISYTTFITPKIDRETLSQLITKGEIDSMRKLMRYLFVITVTLLLMSEVGVNQNDLHWGNILMSKAYVGPSPRHLLTYFMVFNDTVYLIDNPRIPILFDFDRAAIRNVRVHELMTETFYSKGGNCPRFHPKRDFLKTVCCIWHYSANVANGSAFQDDIMSRLVLDKTIRDAIRRSHRACWLTTLDEQSSVLCDNRLLDKGLVSRGQIIDWISAYTGYKTCTLSDLQTSSAKARDMCKTFLSSLRPSDLKSTAELKKTIQCNVQVVNTTTARKKREQLHEEVSTHLLQCLLSVS